MKVEIAWVLSGVLSALGLILKTGILPFIVPGLIVGVCGAVFHSLLDRFIPRSMWWLSAIIVTVTSIVVTLLLIPDARHWVLTRILLAYFSILTLTFCFIKYVVERRRDRSTSEDA